MKIPTPLLALLCVPMLIPNLPAASSHPKPKKPEQDAPSPSYSSGGPALKATFVPTDGEFNPNLLEISFTGPQILSSSPHHFFLALQNNHAHGSPLVPYGANLEGSSLALPFPASHLYLLKKNSTGTYAVLERAWEKVHWSDWKKIADLSPSLNNPPTNTTPEISLEADSLRLQIPVPKTPAAEFPSLRVALWAKDMSADQGWGSLLASLSPHDPKGNGQITLRHFLEILPSTNPPSYTIKTRNNTDVSKMRIYQLLPRLFGNTNETRKLDGSLKDNGVGKFNDLTDKALAELKFLGFTHLWLTGIHQQSTATDYSKIEEPADDPDLLKGRAGSPYAIKDYFDLCPDYASDPTQRFQEFKDLIQRIHTAGLQVFIDFVPNHVSRAYHSNIRPNLSFGDSDDRSQFFDPKNNFFWLQTTSPDGPPLKLPKNSHPEADGLFAPETSQARVTGDNMPAWTPPLHSWYETVKLNYGFDFTTLTREFPNHQNPNLPIPNTWTKMDQILAYWQDLGVDGFRVDMAHMIPPEFWQWAISRAKERNPNTFFFGEAYNDSPYKIPSAYPLSANHNDVLFDLLAAGFDSIYNHKTYKTLKNLYDQGGWANDLDTHTNSLHPLTFDSGLTYTENHDEVRQANKSHWGGLGSKVAPATTALLLARSRGPVMIYHGQEVGEPANHAEGFGGADARTSIFDYFSMPEFTKWVNNGQFDGEKLSPDQKSLRAFYGQLLPLLNEPAFRDGDFYPLNTHNTKNPHFGRLNPTLQASGQWIYAFLRHHKPSNQTFLVVVNLHPKTPMDNVRILLPESVKHLLPKTPEIRLSQKLSQPSETSQPLELSQVTHTALNQDENGGIKIPNIPPLTPYFFEIEPKPQPKP